MKSKIHRARVTSADLHYEGSISIDQDLIKAADLSIYEHVHIWNINSGARFETYVIPAPRGSGMIQINGAASHNVKPGDLVIIASFAHYPKSQSKRHKPKVVFVNEKNQVKFIARKSGSKDPMPVS